jgi:hypothetical protein
LNHHGFSETGLKRTAQESVLVYARSWSVRDASHDIRSRGRRLSAARRTSVKFSATVDNPKIDLAKRRLAGVVRTISALTIYRRRGQLELGHWGQTRQPFFFLKQAEYSLSTVYWNVVPLSRGKDL